MLLVYYSAAIRSTVRWSVRLSAYGTPLFGFYFIIVDGDFAVCYNLPKHEDSNILDSLNAISVLSVLILEVVNA